METNKKYTFGLKERYVCFDTEFTGLHKNTTLISIGCTTSDGKTFYGEMTDYDKSQVNEWIETNVIKNLRHPGTVLEGDHWSITGTKTEVGLQLLMWLGTLQDERKGIIQMVSDVCQYDFVLFLDLILQGKDATQLPDFISPSCVELNDILATTIYGYDRTKGSVENPITPSYVAFQANREQLGELFTASKYDASEKHNSLFDAKVIADIFFHLVPFED